MEYLFIYLLQVADVLSSISCVFTILFIIFCGGILVNCISTSIDGYAFFPDKEDKEFRSSCYQLYVIRGYLIKSAIITFIISCLLCFLPTKQTLLLMGGTYLGKKAVNAVVTDEKIKKVDTIIKLQLDKYIKELQKQN